MLELELEFTTDDDDARELCRQYWQLEQGSFVHRVSDLARTFDIPQSRIPSVVARNCRAYKRAESCPACGSPRPFSSRSDYTMRSRAGTWPSGVCAQCRAEKAAEVQRQSEAREQRRVNFLREGLERARAQGLDIEDLTFTDAVFLVAVVRTGAAEDFSYIMPTAYYRAPLSPTETYDRQILDHLYKNHLLCIHPGSHKDTILVGDDDTIRFYPMKVHWAFPTPPDGPSPAKFVEMLEARLRDPESWPPWWGPEADDVYDALALQECVQYLQICLQEHNLEFNPGEKTYGVLRAVLNNFSIGQALNFIWRATKDAAAFYMRGSSSKAHAANTVPGSIERAAERAIAEQWSIRPFRRDRRIPESTLSSLVFTAILKLPDGGFAERPLDRR